MESMNYTYEKKKVSTTGRAEWRPITVKHKSWVILNPKGRRIAEATSEKQAALIVSALNGTA